ncbi:MAG: hypothetical protein J0L92_07145 [Deltaproteobacteria bacterium]|nr:hypothetical protein [Deltaproteobacteria bacterium]
MRSRLAALGLTLCSLLVAGCTRAATQLVVEIDSDLPAVRLGCVRVEVSPRDDETDVSAQTFHVALDRTPHVEIPFSFGVTPPRDDDRARVEVSASAYRSEVCSTEAFDTARSFVTRRVRTGFLSGRALRLPMFLSTDCVGVVCAPTETCDLGRCVPVPEIDPNTLLTTSSTDDAGTRTRLPTFIPDRPEPGSEVVQGPAMNLHDTIYPVGVSVGTNVLIAGAITSDVTFGTRTIAAGSGTVFLAKLAADAGATPDWVVTLQPALGSFPVIRRVEPLPMGGYAFCGTASAPFDVDGRADPIGGGAAHFGFVGLIDAEGNLLPASIHTLDAIASMTAGTMSPHARCTDLVVSGGQLVATVRTWNASAPRVDSAMRATDGVFLDTAQNLLLYRISIAGGDLVVADPIVVGHAETTLSMDMLSFEGTPFYARAIVDTDDQLVVAAVADDLAHDGTTRTDPSATELSVRRIGATSWSRMGLVRTSPAVEVHLEALDTSPSFVWLAVTIQLGMMSRSDVTIPPLAPFTITEDGTYLVRLDARTGDGLGVTLVPENVDALFPEDNTGAATSEDNQLYGGWLTTTGRDEALYATASLDGDRFEDETLSVGAATFAQADPFLAIVGASNQPIASWQWSHAPEHSDWRLTHVAWIPAGFVVVSGYVESTGTETEPDRSWRRDRSFFEILRSR